MEPAAFENLLLVSFVLCKIVIFDPRHLFFPDFFDLNGLAHNKWFIKFVEVPYHAHAKSLRALPHFQNLNLAEYQ